MPARKPPKGSRLIPAGTFLRRREWTPASAQSLLQNPQRGVYINLLAIHAGISHEKMVAALKRLARQKK